MRSTWLLVVTPIFLLPAATAWAQGLEVVPATVADDFRPFLDAIDTVSLVNHTAGDLRVDSITIRFLDGGANPRPADFTACKTCPHDSIYAYNYDGWIYGPSLDQSLRYLRDSLFLIQDRNGVPVTKSLAPGASAPFILYYPANCRACARIPTYPGATRYAFTFIASEGSRAQLTVTATPVSMVPKWVPPLEMAVPGTARDAAGRSNSGAGRAVRYFMPAPSAHP